MLRIVLQSHRILDQGRELGNPWVQPVLTDKKWDLLAILKCVRVCVYNTVISKYIAGNKN